MAKGKRRSKHAKEKLIPIPHNNRANTRGRLVRQQIIKMIDKDDPTKITQKTIFHMNLTPYEQRRIHMIKTAVADNDINVLKKLNPRERMLYDKLLKEKEKKDGGQSTE